MCRTGLQSNNSPQKSQKMKKLIFLGVIAIFSKTMVAQANSQSMPPEAVVNAFNTRFPNAHVRSWEERKEGFIADFRLDGKKTFAYFAPDGTWKGTERPIKWTKNLPAAVRSGWMN